MLDTKRTQHKKSSSHPTAAPRRRLELCPIHYCTAQEHLCQEMEGGSRYETHHCPLRWWVSRTRPTLRLLAPRAEFPSRSERTTFSPPPAAAEFLLPGSSAARAAPQLAKK